MKNKIFAVMPAVNEEEIISKLVNQTKKYVDEVVIIDDGSIDKTSELAKKTGATVLRHEINLGKGAALKTGCDYAFKQGANIILNLDADGQHNPKDIPKFLKALKSTDLVHGSRQFNNNMPFIKRAWNFGISRVFSVLYGVEVYDQQCGFRAFTADTYRNIRWRSTDYLVETEILVNLLKSKLNLKEVSIETIYIKEHRGVSPTYGFRHLLAMILWRL
jgi:glycosyltransferase involved in cell wall biosynthesis